MEDTIVIDLTDIKPTPIVKSDRQRICITDKKVVDSFTLKDIKDHIEQINVQIQLEKDNHDLKIQSLRAEKQSYIDKLSKYSNELIA